jgi:hypothetical protein
MAIASSSGKNIWVAASDGDLERVKVGFRNSFGAETMRGPLKS